MFRMPWLRLAASHLLVAQGMFEARFAGADTMEPIRARVVNEVFKLSGRFTKYEEVDEDEDEP